MYYKSQLHNPSGIYDVYISDDKNKGKDAIIVPIRINSYKWLLDKNIATLPYQFSRYNVDISLYSGMVKAIEDIYGIEHIPIAVRNYREILLGLSVAIYHFSYSIFYLLPMFTKYVLNDDKEGSSIFGSILPESMKERATDTYTSLYNLYRSISGSPFYPFHNREGIDRSIFNDIDSYMAFTGDMLWEIIIFYRENIDLIFDRLPVIEFNSLTANSINKDIDFYSGYFKLFDKNASLLHIIQPKNFYTHVSFHRESFSPLPFSYINKMGFPTGSYYTGAMARVFTTFSVHFKEIHPLLKEIKTIANKDGKNIFISILSRLFEVNYILANIKRLKDEIQSDFLPNLEAKPIAKETSIVSSMGANGTSILYIKSDKNGRLKDIRIVHPLVHNNYIINLATIYANVWNENLPSQKRLQLCKLAASMLL